MNYLMDTHAFLWFVLGDTRLSTAAKACMLDPKTQLLLSPASYWELGIKISLGKYKLDQPFSPFMASQLADNEMELLPITFEHASVVSQLPFHHRDPFDRMLVAQALVEGVSILSGDEAFDAYEVSRIW